VGGWLKPRTAALPQEGDPVPFVQEAGWSPGSVYTGAENLVPHRDSTEGSTWRMSYFQQVIVPYVEYKIALSDFSCIFSVSLQFNNHFCSLDVRKVQLSSVVVSLLRPIWKYPVNVFEPGTEKFLMFSLLCDNNFILYLINSTPKLPIASHSMLHNLRSCYNSSNSI
jgi:hypothetical protein